ncbi:hypothetical protein ACFX2H_038332 [Malus domestica]
MKRLQVAPPASASDEIENGDAKAIYRDDRFSALPDEVVHHILPPLPFSDVIRVGSLSKRCGQVCSSIPTLNFSEFPSDSTANFVNRLELLASLDNFFVNRNGKSGDLAMLGTIIKARSFSTCTISNLVRLRLKNVMMEDAALHFGVAPPPPSSCLLRNLSMYLRYLSLYWRGYATINLRNPGEFNNLEKAELDRDMDSSTTHDQLILSRVLQSVKVLNLRD